MENKVDKEAIWIFLDNKLNDGSGDMREIQTEILNYIIAAMESYSASQNSELKKENEDISHHNKLLIQDLKDQREQLAYKDMAIKNIYDLLVINIPYYAYGDHEAACSLSDQINHAREYIVHEVINGESITQLQSTIIERDKECERLQNSLLDVSKKATDKIAEQQRTIDELKDGYEKLKVEVQYYLYGIEILKKLFNLKHYKDTVGKDSIYEREQPQTWKQANDFLNTLVNLKEVNI